MENVTLLHNHQTTTEAERSETTNVAETSERNPTSSVANFDELKISEKLS